MGTDVVENLEISLQAAVEANELRAATTLIKQGANVNKRGPTPYTPLMIAAGRGYVQMTDILLAAGADVYVVDSTLGASALHKAAQSGVVDVARLLLDHGAFIDLQSAVVGHTPLVDAVWAKKPAMVKFLLERGATINLRGRHGAAAIDFLGQEPNWTAGGTVPESEAWGKEIRELLEGRQKANEEAISRQPLMQAVLSNDLDEVKRLIAAGEDVNEKSPVVGSGNDGQTPLLVACFNGFVEVAEALIEAGANPRIVDYLLKATPGHKSTFSGHPGPIKLLLDQGKLEFNAQGPYNGYTILHDAIWHGHIETVKVLLEDPRVRLDLQGLDGNTPAELAEQNGYTEIAALVRAKMAEG